MKWKLGHAVLDVVNGAGRSHGPGENCDQMLVYRRARTKMVHYGHVLRSDKTGCGRSFSEACYKYARHVDVAFPNCKRCFGHVSI